MTRRDEGYGWWTDDEPAFSRDESQGPVDSALGRFVWALIVGGLTAWGLLYLLGVV